MSGSPKSCSVPGCEGPIKGTGLCAKHCSTCFRDDTVIHWANKDNTYSRNLDDYIALCAKCHWAYDKTYNGKRTGRNYKQLLALRSFT